jgi:amino acid permease
MSPSRFAGAYRTLGTLMVTTIVGAGVLLTTVNLAGIELWYATIFLIEAVLLVLFVAFWVLQTAENWDEEAVEDATCSDAAGPPTSPPANPRARR